MKQKILFVRTFRAVGTGGPVPPLEILSAASFIMKQFPGVYEYKVLDCGFVDLDFGRITQEIRQFAPDIIFLNGLVWEADIVHRIARIVKNISEDIVVVAYGQLVTLVQSSVVVDQCIDYGVVGEAEYTIVELLRKLKRRDDLSQIDGLIYKENKNIRVNSSRAYVCDVEELTLCPDAWDLIDIKEYARFANWNGSLKEKFYVPVVTSRGCPFECTFCCNRNSMGKEFRARTPQHVLSEIKFLYGKYHMKEIHIFDAVFNYDIERAKEICRLLISSGLHLSIAFPHGLRPDKMTNELIYLLKKAGTYKLVYGIETANPRLQKIIKKNLNIEAVKAVIAETNKAGIITGGYFMLGFSSETSEEMQETIDFAVNSDLDIASFFKVTPYADLIDQYQDILSAFTQGVKGKYQFEDFSYYAKKRSSPGMSAKKLNALMLGAQQRFYLKGRRMWRGFDKAPHKIIYVKNMFNALSFMLQSYLVNQLFVES